MAAVIDQLNFWDLHCFQFLLSLPINHMQFLHTIQEHNCAWVYPLQIKHTEKKKKKGWGPSHTIIQDKKKAWPLS